MSEYYIGPYRDHYAIFDSLDRVQTQYDTHAEAKADLDSYNKTGEPLPESVGNVLFGILAFPFLGVLAAGAVLTGIDKLKIKKTLKTGKGAYKISYDKFNEMYTSILKLLNDIQKLQKSSKYYNLIYKYNKIYEATTKGNKMYDEAPKVSSGINVREEFKKGTPVRVTSRCIYYQSDCLDEYKDFLKSRPNTDKSWSDSENEDYIRNAEEDIFNEFESHLVKLGFKSSSKDSHERSPKYPGIYIESEISGDGVWLTIKPDYPNDIFILDNESDKKKMNEDHSEISNDPEIEELLNLAGCTIEDLDMINNEEDIKLDDDDPIDVNTSREIDAIMDESTEARNKLNEIRKSENVKNIKSLIKEGNKLTKTDLDSAAEKYEEAKNLLVELRKEINTIPNDDTVSGIVYMILNLLKQTFTEPITIFFGLYRIPTRIHKMSKYEALVMYDKLVSKLEYGINKLKLAKKKNNKIANESFLGIKSEKEKNAKELTKDEFDKLINDMVSINDAIISKLKTSKWWKIIFEPCYNNRYYKTPEIHEKASNFKRDFSAGKYVKPAFSSTFVNISDPDPDIYADFIAKNAKSPNDDEAYEKAFDNAYYESKKIIKEAIKKLGFNDDGKSTKYPDIKVRVGTNEYIYIGIEPIYSGYYKLKEPDKKSQNESIDDLDHLMESIFMDVDH